MSARPGTSISQAVRSRGRSSGARPRRRQRRWTLALGREFRAAHEKRSSALDAPSGRGRADVEAYAPGGRNDAAIISDPAGEVSFGAVYRMSTAAAWTGGRTTSAAPTGSRSWHSRRTRLPTAVNLDAGGGAVTLRRARAWRPGLTIRRDEPKIYRVAPESGSTLRILWGFSSQTAGSTCEFRVNPVNFPLWAGVAA